MFRTLLFIPGNNKKFLDKSKSLSPDIICYDHVFPTDDWRFVHVLHFKEDQEINTASCRCIVFTKSERDW